MAKEIVKIGQNYKYGKKNDKKLPTMAKTAEIGQKWPKLQKLAINGRNSRNW